ncbi:hypothetical protein A2257_03720 [Candidatus Falkowbacteria bacterium RIFOXYA2_FULL_38_12]|uniref:Calx-beta domain-containing protein n=1 Tax=Candidatus Falkowbacteria bacterium RIFOXYA2_FULL_38_12 TaxID=1797993 RepID=A0A1F5S4D2_9BACT|nr:MAG: hypothetical protein A2257_03720 [Candidatus Falkowbacteria bacterium RIFOXYA2_FULL_38_12]
MYSRSTQGKVINVGTEATAAGDNMLNGVVIQNNTIYGALYYNPALADVSTHSIFVGYNANASIKYNTVIGGGYAIVIKGGGMEYSSGGIFYNKIINSTGVASLRVKGIKNANIFNNVIYANSSISGTYYPVHIGQNGEGEVSTGTVLKNNIIVGGGGSKLIYIESSSTTGFVSNYNLLYRHNEGYIGYNGTNYSFSSWQGLGYDANSINSDPLFTDPNNYNVTVSPVSPTINAGTDVGLSQDFLGVAVPQGTSPDIGLYELYVPNSVPSSLIQYKSNGTTIIETGSLTNETTVVFKMGMSSLNSADSLTPQIEIRELGSDFTNTFTNSGSAVLYSGVGVTGEVTVTGLKNGTAYHWQARISNSAGSSSWTSYGSNLESVADFETDPPTIQFTSASSSGAESSTSVNLELSLSGISSKEITVGYSVTGGTASGSGVDYTLGSGTAIISAGSLTTNISLTVVNDSIDEDNETVQVAIADPSNATLGSNTVFTYTVNDNDDPPTVTLSVNPATIAEASEESVITSTLSATSGKTITIDLLYSGTATGSGADYTASSAEIIIVAGGLTGTATVTSVQDLTNEANETIIIDINSVTNGSESGTQQETITINDDDCATVDNTATYNSYPTCGPATCNVGYVLSAGACILSGGIGGVSSPSSTGSGVANAQASGIGVSLNVGEINRSGTNVLTYITNQNNFVAPESGYDWQPSSHSFNINNFDLLNGIVTIVFSSEPKTVILAKGQTKDVDLGGDGVSDIRVTFSGIFVNRAEITIQSLINENNQKNNKPDYYEGRLIKYIAHPKIYLIKNNKKHWIVDELTFNYFGYKWSSVETIFESTAFADGDNIVAPKLSKFVFSRNLKIGMTGNDVKELQKYLNSKNFLVAKEGAGSPGQETPTFGPATKAALINFQKAKKIDPAIGFFGSITRDFINK